MKVKELIAELKKKDPEGEVRFRDNTLLKSITIVVNCDLRGWESMVELTNEECNLRRRGRR